jgi:hypothetical protein
MAAHAESLSLPNPPVHRLLMPALWALVTALLAVLRRLARQPSMPRMSEQWLLSLERESGRFLDL